MVLDNTPDSAEKIKGTFILEMLEVWMVIWSVNKEKNGFVVVVENLLMNLVWKENVVFIDNISEVVILASFSSSAVCYGTRMTSTLQRYVFILPEIIRENSADPIEIRDYLPPALVSNSSVVVEVDTKRKKIAREAWIPIRKIIKVIDTVKVYTATNFGIVITIIQKDIVD